MKLFDIVCSIFAILLSTSITTGVYNNESIDYYHAALKTHVSDRQKAVSLYILALKSYWEFPEAHQNLAIEYEHAGDTEKARQHHEYSFHFARSDDFQIGALNNLIQFELKVERVPQSSKVLYWIDLCNQALRAFPNSSETLFTKGRLFAILGNEFQAAKIYEEILKFDPFHIRAILNIGNYFFRLRNFPRATEIYEYALSIVPPNDSLNIAILSGNLAQSYREQGSLHRALHYLSLGYRHGRSEKSKLFSLVTMYAVKGLLCHWKDYETLEELITYQIEGYMTETGAKSLSINHGDTAESVFDPYTLSLFKYVNHTFDVWIAEKNCPTKPYYSYTLPLLGLNQPNAATPKKLRVGYLSYDWRNHPMGRLTSSLITNYISSKDVDIYCFSYGEDDLSFIRVYVRKYCHHFIDLFPFKYDYNASDIIYEHQVDLLIDITSHTYNNRIGIACLRPAPIVINYLGYPGTTGCAGFDYTIVDSQIAPVDQMMFSEKLIYLPFGYQSNFMPLHIGSSTFFTANTTVTTTAASVHDKSSSGLRICAFNANKKFEPIAFQTWMNILNRLPNAIIYFLDIPDEAVVMLEQYGYFYGIDAKKRFRFLSRIPWTEHLLRASFLCDLALDNFIYGAHTTASDLLWIGIPIVTLRGYGQNRMPSRIPSSILMNILPVMNDNMNHNPISQKLMDLLIQDDIQQYEDIVVRIATTSYQSNNNDRNNNGKYSLMDQLKDWLQTVICYSPTFHREMMASAMTHVYEMIEDAKYFSSRDSHKSESNHVSHSTSFASYHLILSPQYFENITSRNFCLDDVERMLSYHVAQQKQNNEISLNTIISGENEEKINLCDSNDDTRSTCASVYEWNGEFSSIVEIHRIISRLQSSVPMVANIANDDNNIQAKTTDIHRMHDVLNRLTSLLRKKIHSAILVQHVVNQTDGIDRPMEEDITEAHGEVVKEYLLSMLQDWVSSGNNSSSSSNDDTQEYKQYEREELFTVVYSYLLHSYPTIAIQCLSSMQTKLFALSPLLEIRLFHIVTSKVLLLANKNQSNESTEQDEWCTQEHFLSDILHPNYELIYYQSSVSNDNNGKATAYPAILFTNYFPCMAKRLFDYSFPVNHYEFAIHEPSNTHVLQTTASEYIFQHVILHQQAKKKHPINQHSDFISNREIFHWSVLAYALDHENHNKLLNIGVLMIDCHADYHLYGYHLAQLATIMIHKQRQGLFQNHLQSWAKETHQNVKDLQSETILAGLVHINVENKVVEESNVIVFYTYEYGQSWWPGWGPRSFSAQSSSQSTDNNWGGQAVGGSEEAVYYLARECVKLGYQVIIYGDLVIEDRGVRTQIPGYTHSILWLHYLDFNPMIRWPVFISWRYTFSLALGRTAKKSFLWLHDLLPWTSLPPLQLLLTSSYCHHILVQSDFHQSYLISQYDSFLHSVSSVVALSSFPNVVKEHLPIVLKVLPNGVSEDAWQDHNNSNDGIPEDEQMNNNTIFVYGSAPNRGLDMVLTQWPTIKQAIPAATLHVYYGFTEKAIAYLKAQKGEQGFIEWFATMQKLLQQEGVVYHGPVNHDTLAKAYAEGGFLLYPTTFPETGCITMIRAMIAGMLPITSRYQSSVLSNLGEEFDLGPHDLPLTETHVQQPIAFYTWLTTVWTPAVIAAYHKPPEELRQLRAKMKTIMRTRYSWHSSAKQLLDL